MKSTEAAEIPWDRIGEPLEALVKAEREIGYYEHASYDLLAAVVHGPDDSVWRRFLLEDGNLETVVGQVIALSRMDSETPRSVLDSTRELVEAAADDDGETSPLLAEYLKHRPFLPSAVRDEVDGDLGAGESAAAERVIAFGLELRRLEAQSGTGRLPGEIVAHWYRAISRGEVSLSQARSVPAQLAEVTARLLPHVRQVARDEGLGEEAVYERCGPAFTNPDIPGAVEVMITATSGGLTPDPSEVEQFLKNLTTDEALRRMKRLAEWTAEYRPHEHGRLVVTPKIAEYLSRGGDFDSLLEVLDRLELETHEGRFHIDNPLQRDLEFGRFSQEYQRSHGTYRLLPYSREPFEEMYRMFSKLKELPPVEEEEFELSEEHRAQANRLAYEAAGFLRFLREFRDSTSRPIVVVGNDRYGRQWVVEPIEELLGDGFTIRYDRVPSHMSTKLRVPSARLHEGTGDGFGAWSSNVFPREFVREINETMPHIVVVDGMNPGGEHGLMRFSRGTKGYAQWFAAFNDLRAEGDVSKYESESCLPADHLAVLRHWYEFVRLQRQLQQWVSPGPTYRVTLWAPEPTEIAHLGEIRVPCVSPDIESEQPQVVLAAPMIYRTEGDDLPEALQGTRPYYFDGPEKLVKESIVFGFGPHGFQPRVEGTMTATFVDAVQRYVAAEVKKMIGE